MSRSNPAPRAQARPLCLPWLLTYGSMLDNHIEEAFEMADRVTGKILVEEEKRIKGAVDHKIKMKVEIKNTK